MSAAVILSKKIGWTLLIQKSSLHVQDGISINRVGILVLVFKDLSDSFPGQGGCVLSHVLSASQFNVQIASWEVV